MRREYRSKRYRVNYKNIVIAIISVLAIVFAGIKVTGWIFKKDSTVYLEKKYGNQKIEKINKGKIVYLTTPNKKLNEILLENANKVKDKIKENRLYDCSSALYFNTIAQVNCSLKEGNNVLEYSKLAFNITSNETLTFDKIFRDNTRRVTDVVKNLSEVDKNVINIDDTHITLGNDDKNVKIVIKDNVHLFKTGNGLPTLFQNKQITPRQFTYEKGKKIVALTFDDGPLNAVHGKIRDLLNQHNIPGTFYVIGNLVERNPDEVLKTYQSGHTIANHSYTHPGLFNKNLTNIGDANVKIEYDKTDDAIFKVIGKDATTTRPPGGFVNKKVAALTNQKQVMWSVDSLDWKNRNADAVYNAVKQNIHNYSVVLFHDLYESTYEALKRLIPELKQEGYTFVGIDTFLELCKEVKNGYCNIADRY